MSGPRAGAARCAKARLDVAASQSALSASGLIIGILLVRGCRVDAALKIGRVRGAVVDSNSPGRRFG
jgi:hypothetical protein